MRKVYKVCKAWTFESLLSEVKPAEELLTLPEAIIKEQWDIRLENVTVKREKTKHEVSELSVRISNLMTRLSKTTDNVIAESIENEIKELLRIKQEKENELNKTVYSQEEFRTATESVFNVLGNPMAMWKSEALTDKKAVLLMFSITNCTMTTILDLEPLV